MKVKCLHGYFLFHETRPGQIADFISMTGIDMSPVGNQYTFDDLSTAPSYSIIGKNYLDVTAIKTFEGNVWEVFEANKFVYDFSTGLIVPIDSITTQVKIELSLNRYLSDGLIIPGSVTKSGQRVKNYSAWYSRGTQRWLYSDVEYV